MKVQTCGICRKCTTRAANHVIATGELEQLLKRSLATEMKCRQCLHPISHYISEF